MLSNLVGCHGSYWTWPIYRWFTMIYLLKMVIFHSYVAVFQRLIVQETSRRKLLSCKGAKAPTLCVSAVRCPNSSNNLRNFCPPHRSAFHQPLPSGWRGVHPSPVPKIVASIICDTSARWFTGRSLGRSPTRWGILETFPGFRPRHAPEKLNGTPLKEICNFGPFWVINPSRRNITM